MRLAGLTFSSVPLDCGAAKFDLWLSLRETANGLQADLEYSTDLFDPDTAEHMLGHFRVLLEGIAADPDQPVSQLPLLAPRERQQVLSDWNDTAWDCQYQCLHQLVEDQVARSPEAVAVVCEGRQLTYRELNTRANQLARWLGQFAVQSDVPVGVCLERSVELVVSLLAILKAGGAYAPLDPDYPAETAGLHGPRQSTRGRAHHAGLGFPLAGQRNTAGLLLDEAELEIARECGDNLPLGNRLEDIAYVIYTSGSTGLPKGVRNTHRGICNRLLWLQEKHPLSPADRVLQKTPFSFDVSVWEFFWPLLSGARLVLARPGGHKEPRYLAQLIAAQGITTLHFVPSMLQVFLAEQAARECRSVQRVICSGEALPYELTQQFFSLFKAELYNLYGPTEAAVEVTYWPCRENQHGLVPIGKPIANIQCYILDAHGNPVPVGLPGELHLGGVGLARDYLNRPELTAEKFIPNPFSSRPGARLYKTGDLCRYLPDGNILYLGRLDQQVKIRGNRIELGEIQATLVKHPAVRAAVVTAWRDGSGHQELAAYWLPQASPPPVSELRELLQATLPEYMVPSAFVQLDSIPLNSNGKVDYKALPRPLHQRDQRSPYVPPRNPDEEQLVDIWREVLQADRVGVHDNFFALGGHSLLATQVVSRIASRLHVELPLREMFQTQTVAELAQLVAAARTGGTRASANAIPVVPRTDELRPSFTQEALWFLDQLERDRPTYTIYSPLRIRGRLQVATVERALSEISRRHEALRTTFPEVHGRPVQRIAESAPQPLPLVDFSHLPEPQRTAEVQRWILAEMGRPIDLQHGPLIRIAFLRLAADDHVVLVSTHHIIYDGWSMAVLLRELASLYAAFEADQPSPLPELPIQYADFVAWQRQRLQGAELERLRSYWVQQLGGVPPLELPTDHPRPAIRTTRGATRSFQLSPTVTQALLQFCRREGATPFMTLLAAWQMLLRRYSGQDDFAIGSPVANRSQPETEPLIGYFVNVVVLRSDVSGDPSFREVLRRVRQVTLDAYDHQDLTLDQVVNALNPPRDLSRHPLFQVMFALQNIELPTLDQFGLTLTPFEEGPALRSSYFDLTLGVWQAGQTFRGELDYSTDLFEAATIDRLVQHYEALLAAALADLDCPVSALPLLTDEERRNVVVAWNDTASAYRRDLCLSQLFEAQAERVPDAVAVVLDGQRWTYRELNARANQLAHVLQGLGLGPEVRVGICLERSPELLMAVLGVLKAGGAYVPLDPAYTQAAEERLSFVLQDAQVSLVVTNAALSASLGACPVPRLVLDGGTADGLHAASRENMAPVATAENLAYVLYTSGSTGRPKGVLVTQRNLLSAYHGWEQAYRLGTEVTAHLQMASFAFDVFAGDLVRALCSGGKLVICRKEILLDPPQLLDLMRREQIELAEFVPLVLRNLVQHLEETGQTLDFPRIVIAGSDAWYVADHQRTQRVLGPQTRLLNSYGLTETTIDSSFFEGDVHGLADAALVPIGRPLANVRLYVLDEQQRPLPIGVPGELYIGGDGVSRGYQNPDLNASRFVPDPFAAEPQARLCRTGDRARWRADGQVEFLGRADNQVKIRGFRVEPGEVEQALREHPSLAAAAVVARERIPGDLRLVAYVVGLPESTPDEAELRHYLRQRLPEYMVPSAWSCWPACPPPPAASSTARRCLSRTGVVRRGTVSTRRRAPTPSNSWR